MIINNHSKAGFFRGSSWSNMFEPAVELPALLGHIVLDDFRVVFALWSAAFEGHLHRILLCQKTSSWRFCHLTFVLQGTLRLVRCKNWSSMDIGQVWIFVIDIDDIRKGLICKGIVDYPPDPCLKKLDRYLGQFFLRLKTRYCSCSLG